MKKLLLASLLLAGTAQADGCWVNYNNPNYCSNEVLTCTFDLSLDEYLYGSQVAGMCGAFRIVADERNACWSDLDTLIGDYNGLVDQFNAQIDELSAQDRLIVKLRKKIRKLKKKLKRG